MKKMLWSVTLFFVYMSSHGFAETNNSDLNYSNMMTPEMQNNIANMGAMFGQLGADMKVKYGAPVLSNWLYQSRDGALNGKNDIKPIPDKIKQALRGMYDDEVLEQVRYTVGDNGMLNLSNLSMQYGHAKAITLIDVIVFKNQDDAENDAVLWSHELKHVQQFNEWGVDDFALKYIGDWNSVEEEAKTAATNFRNQYVIGSQNSIPFSSDKKITDIISGNSQAPLQEKAASCVTDWGVCDADNNLSVNSECYCDTENGYVWGRAE